MEHDYKRKLDSNNGAPGAKKSKQWTVPKKGQHKNKPISLESGDAGIWVTCIMGKEGKCTSDLHGLFEEYAAKLYGKTSHDDEAGEDDNAEDDIEAEISKEVQGLKKSSTKKGTLFQTVKTDIPCVLFFKTRAPVEPVEFVHTICREAMQGATNKYRWVKKLTPMTMMGKATVEGLDKVAKDVLEPVFHAEGTSPKTFAIRPTRRNHNVMKRDDIIKQIARTVGQRHSVDLKNYDHLILVDVYRNMLGMSVVGSDYEELKQYNLTEIHDPTPKPSAGKGNDAEVSTAAEDVPPLEPEESEVEPNKDDISKHSASEKEDPPPTTAV